MVDDGPVASELPESALVSLLVGAHFVGVLLALQLAEQKGVAGSSSVAIGLAAAQINLAAVWVGLGRAPIIYRWGALIAVIAAWIYIGYSPEADTLKVLSRMLGQAGIAVLLGQSLRFAGILLGERTDDVPPGSETPASRARWDLAQLFAVTSAFACLSAAQAMRIQPVTLASLWLDFIDRGPVATIGVAGACAVLWEGPAWWRVLIVIACAAIVGGGQSAVILINAVDWTFFAYRGFMYALNALIVCLSLGVFRKLGYRLTGG